MQFFRDMSVRAKLFGGFGIVLALTIVLGIVLIGQIGTVNSGGVYVGENSLPSVAAVQQIEIDASSYRRWQLAALLATSPSVVSADVTQTKKNGADISRVLKGYGKMISNATDARLWHTAQQQWSAYVSAARKMDQLALDKNASDATMSAASESTRPAYIALSNTLSDWAAANLKWGHEKIKSNGSTYNTAKTLGILLLVIVILVGSAMAVLVSRSIKNGVDVVLDRLRSLQERCMTYVREGLEALSHGDLTHGYEPVTEPIPNPSKDEIGQVATAVNAIRERIIAALDAYNETREKLNDIIGKVSGSAGQVSVASQEMSATSEESGRATGEIANAVGGIAQGAERQVQMVEHARRSAEEVAHAVKEAAENASQTAEAAHEARAVAQQGVGAAEQANAAMSSVRESSVAVSAAIRGLADKSEQVGQIVQTITGIAEQTNLLALNAAIEAARAGEQGRGFAVVAEEVRKLAEESQGAAQEISQLIGAIQAETSHAVQVVEDGAVRTQDGATVVEQTREAFLKIGSSVDDMAGRIEQIAAAAQQVAASAQSMQESVGEVAAVAEESSAATEQVSAATQETSASAEQISSSAQELSSNAEQLNELVAQFKLKS